MHMEIERATLRIARVMEKNRKQYIEADASYRDTGYDRYWNKMQKLDTEYEELKSFMSHIKPIEAHTLFIQTNLGNGYDKWKFNVVTDDSRQYIEDVINEYKHMYESPVELMDYLCDTFGWKWEDYEPKYDISIIM